MRKQFTKTMQSILYQDEDTVLLLGDIGVFGFRDEIKNIPNRVYNIGILEQSMVSLAAGLSKTNIVPFIHTIAPFMVERALEQIKIDFGYQELNGNFISVGASYDYAGLGCTHHCPADIQLCLSIPNMFVFVPGTSQEFDRLLRYYYKHNTPKYFRLGENENKDNYVDMNPGLGYLVKKGSLATLICYGNILDSVLKACNDIDISILYYNSINPFDSVLLNENFNETIIVCEPFYEGTTNYLINSSLQGKKYSLYNIGVPRKFLQNYGTKIEHDRELKLDEYGMKEKIKKCLKL